MRIVRINTSAFSEEDFLIVTNLSDEAIKKVIKPMVKEERNDDSNVFYSNDDYCWALKNAYPTHFVEWYTDDSIDVLKF